MICLVDMEHEEVAQRGSRCAVLKAPGCSVPQAYLEDVRRRLEAIANDPCVIRRYTDVTQAWLDGTGLRALVLSGNVTAWDRYDQANLQALAQIVRTASLPILGLCGGLQFIALAHGAEVAPIRELRGGERDIKAHLGSGYFKEWGFTPVRVVAPDPLFEKLEAPVFLEAHYCEVKSLPPGFELLASTDICRVQAFRQSGTLVYGTQFHPEAYTSGPVDRNTWLVDLVYPNGYTQRQPDGLRLLANFFHVAGLI